jgi:hypothetical protein
MVRDTWVAWAREQPDPKPSWLVPWDDLDDGQRAVDVMIGRELFNFGLTTAIAVRRDVDANTSWGVS